MKRAFIVILLLSALLVTFYLLLIREEKYSQHGASPYSAVPFDTPLLFEAKSIQSIQLSHPLVREFCREETMPFFSRLVEGFDSATRNDRKLAELTGNEKVIIALSATGSRPVPLFILPSGTESISRAYRRTFDRIFAVNNSRILKETFRNREITGFPDTTNQILVYFSLTDKLLLFSPDLNLLKKSIGQIGKQGIDEDPSFIEVKKTVSAQAGFSVFINHSHFPSLLSGILYPDSTDVKNKSIGKNRENPGDFFYPFRNYASWTELDFGTEGDLITFSGITAGKDSVPQFLSLIKKQVPSTLQSDDLLPENTRFFFSLAISDFGQFVNGIKNMGNAVRNTLPLPENSTTDPQSGIAQLLIESAGAEISCGYTLQDRNPSLKHRYVIFGLKNRSQTQMRYQQWFIEYARHNKLKINQHQTEFIPVKDQKFTVWHFPFPELPGSLCGWPFSVCQSGFMVFIENYIVFSDSGRGIEDFILSFLNHQVLSRNPGYVRLRQNLNRNANLTFYYLPDPGWHFPGFSMTNETVKLSGYSRSPLHKIKGIAFQMVNSKGLVFNHSSIFTGIEDSVGSETGRKAASTENKPLKQIWKCKLKGMTGMIQQVINHYDKRNMEVVVQDLENNFYLISHTGNIIWNLPLDGPVLGKIHQIDYLRNGKLQYLFNTRDRLHLIDRKGKSVTGFPKNLDSPASCGVAVFDYEKNLNYRYLIAFENHKVLAFDRAGKKLNDWKFGSSETLVKFPAQHIRFNSKDFIIFKDQFRIYILDRQGNTRVQPDLLFENSDNPLLIDFSGVPILTGTGKDGMIYQLSLDGHVKSIQPGVFSSHHRFNCADFDGDKVSEYIFTDHGKLTLVDETGNTVFSRSFTGEINRIPGIFQFPEGVSLIGVTDSRDDELFLIYPDGRIHETFPLSGVLDFTIGKISAAPAKISLLAARNDGFLYNYLLN